MYFKIKDKEKITNYYKKNGYRVQYLFLVYDLNYSFYLKVVNIIVKNRIVKTIPTPTLSKVR